MRAGINAGRPLGGSLERSAKLIGAGLVGMLASAVRVAYFLTLDAGRFIPLAVAVMSSSRMAAMFAAWPIT